MAGILYDYLKERNDRLYAELWCNPDIALYRKIEIHNRLVNAKDEEDQLYIYKRCRKILSRVVAK